MDLKVGEKIKRIKKLLKSYFESITKLLCNWQQQQLFKSINA
jgi:hypothetical protein